MEGYVLKQRLIVGTGIAALCLAPFLWSGLGGAVLFVSLGCVVLWFGSGEFLKLSARLLSAGQPELVRGFLLAWSWLIALPHLVSCPEWVTTLGRVEVALPAFASLSLVQALRRPSRLHVRFRAVFASVLCVAYLGFTLTYFARVFFLDGLESRGRFLALFAILVVKMTDVGAFAVGGLTARRPGGNHKLVPHISPKKSWEGLAGGIAFGIATSLWAGMAWGERFSAGDATWFSPLQLVLLGTAAALLGFLGDLVESALKRAATFKDSGQLPGLGGVLDFLDSLILVAPLYYALVA